jgi:chromosomal replication initiator protein
MEILIDKLWSQLLERLQLELSPPTFETWIKPASAKQLENNCLIICTPKLFARNWLQKYYINTIAHVVQDIVAYPVEVYITVGQGNEVCQLVEGELA